jgi:hypothetical protein
MINFDFLKNVQIEEHTRKVSTSTREKKEFNPINGADLRVFKDGRIFPSVEFANRHNLEYQNRDSEDQGNGLDIFRSSKWDQYKGDTEIMIIAVVPKSEAKVDAFGSTKYNEDGTPKASVLEQGNATFGKQLVEDLREVYSINFEESDYVDLTIYNHSFKTSNEIYFFPKTIVRGENKGKDDYIRREKTTPYPLVIFTPELNSSPEAEEVQEIEEVELPETEG